MWPEPQKKPHLSLVRAESRVWGLACSVCMCDVRRVTPLSFAVEQLTVHWGAAWTGCKLHPLMLRVLFLNNNNKKFHLFVSSSRVRV